MMFFKVACGKHIADRTYKKGEIVCCTDDLVKQYPNKFVRVVVVDGRELPYVEYPAIYHAGDLGDVVYFCATLRRLAEIRKHPVSITLHTYHTSRALMTRESADSLISLLSVQPYVFSASFQNTKFIPKFAYNANRFRGNLPTRNLALWQLEHMAAALGFDAGVKSSSQIVPWIKKIVPHRIASVIMARSPRYHNDTFPWKVIRDRYCGKAVFVGSPDEHKEFTREFGMVPYYPTPNLLELARILADADLFVGNQSCPLAVALGVGVKTIQEVYQPEPNCMFHRMGDLPIKFNDIVTPEMLPE